MKHQPMHMVNGVLSILGVIVAWVEPAVLGAMESAMQEEPEGWTRPSDYQLIPDWHLPAVASEISRSFWMGPCLPFCTWRLSILPPQLGMPHRFWTARCCLFILR